MIRAAVVLFLGIFINSFAANTSDWTEVTAEAMDVRALTPRAQAALQAKEFHWKHAQTARFVVHFENGIFAAKVARLAEFMCTYISDDLKDVQDRTEGRSHIFIFRNDRDWKTYREAYAADIPQWSFSYAEGPAMYLQQSADIGSSASTLSHEMTHLVMNRFLPGRLPLWLNEGLAEWYGEFAYSAYKGVKKSRRSSFHALSFKYPISDVLNAEVYPDADVHAFYLLSKHLVAFLQLEKPTEFPAFLKEVSEGASAQTALQKHYGFADEAAFEKEFWKFAR